MKKLPWEEMRRCFEQEGWSRERIARHFGAAYTTVCNRARREDWRALPSLTQGLRESAQRALACLQQEECPDIRAMKELTAILRELTNLEKSLENKDGGVIQVVLAPEIDVWSE